MIRDGIVFGRQAETRSNFGMPSFSTRTVVYKGLLLAPQVGGFYEDLRNPLTISALALLYVVDLVTMWLLIPERRGAELE